jgi:hypothetical protein
MRLKLIKILRVISKVEIVKVVKKVNDFTRIFRLAKNDYLGPGFRYIEENLRRYTPEQIKAGFFSEPRYYISLALRLFSVPGMINAIRLETLSLIIFVVEYLVSLYEFFYLFFDKEVFYIIGSQLLVNMNKYFDNLNLSQAAFEHMLYLHFLQWSSEDLKFIDLDKQEKKDKEAIGISGVDLIRSFYGVSINFFFEYLNLIYLYYSVCIICRVLLEKLYLYFIVCLLFFFKLICIVLFSLVLIVRQFVVILVPRFGAVFERIGSLITSSILCLCYLVFFIFVLLWEYLINLLYKLRLCGIYFYDVCYFLFYEAIMLLLNVFVFIFFSFLVFSLNLVGSLCLSCLFLFFLIVNISLLLISTIYNFIKFLVKFRLISWVIDKFFQIPLRVQQFINFCIFIVVNSLNILFFIVWIFKLVLFAFLVSFVYIVFIIRRLVLLLIKFIVRIINLIY